MFIVGSIDAPAVQRLEKRTQRTRLCMKDVPFGSQVPGLRALSSLVALRDLE